MYAHWVKERSGLMEICHTRSKVTCVCQPCVTCSGYTFSDLATALLWLVRIQNQVIL